MKYLITGASGHLGQKVVANLRTMTAEANIRLGIHNMKKRDLFEGFGGEISHLDYHDPDTVNKSFTDVDVLVYIPSITYNLSDRIDEFENVLAGAQRNKVGSFIFVSFFADQMNNPFQMSPFYAYVPRRLAGSGLSYAYVRNSLYADPLAPYLPELIERGNVIYPVGDSPMSFISRDDSAKAIASLAVQAVMRDRGQSYLLSMPHNYNMVELSKIMSKVTGKHIGYHPVSLQEFADIYAAEGNGNELASMYAGGAMGLLAETSHAFHRLTGEDPMEMEEYLRKNYQPTD